MRLKCSKCGDKLFRADSTPEGKVVVSCRNNRHPLVTLAPKEMESADIDASKEETK
jgi:hypothetical protein